MSEKPSLSQRALSQMAKQTALPPEASDAAYLDGLNAPQREAVLTTEGPVLMLAGAGTGKTRALTSRLAHIIATRKAAPWQVLAVTFTNKAAREMKERIGHLVGDQVEGMRWLGTFHSIAAVILRMHAELVGLKSSFTIIDSDDMIRVCKDLINAANLDEKRWPGRQLAGVIDAWKNRGLTPEQVPPREADSFADGKAIEFYHAYQARLKDLNVTDFGDLLLHNISIFQNYPDVLGKFHDRFRYMLVDEYQDTNIAQYLWLRLLARKNHNICVVGDDDQSIYGWRGAEVGNILRFEKDFPGAKVIRLEQNYRSTPAILAAASGLIDANKNRLGKTLWTEQKGGDKVQLRGVWDGEEEARTICDDIEMEQRKGRSLSDMAVLVRTAAQMRAFEDRFNLIGIAYQVIGGPRFYEREETRDALAYLRLVRNPDDDLSFERILNKPRRGFGDKAIQTLKTVSRSANLSMHAVAIHLLSTDEMKGKARTNLTLFISQLDGWRQQAAHLPPAELASNVLDDSGYTDFWKNSKSPQAQGKLENLKELIQATGEFETLPAYLDHVALVSEINEESGQGLVSLMTLHAAKGLEFPVVFLPGWEEGLFPSQRALDESGAEGLEEERRLAYVGITRAREICRISFVANRLIYGKWLPALPSRFIDELPEQHVDIVSQPGLYGASASDMPAYSSFSGLKMDEDTYYDNPGWRRARQSKMRGSQSRGQPQPELEARAELVASSSPGQSKFKPGSRVHHQKFGPGTVRFVDGNKLEVAFDHAGIKKVLDAYLELPA